MSWQVLESDCIEAMREMDAASVDAIVTDPPYGLGFMGKEWDGLPPGLPWARECLRVLKPGGHLLAFGGTRTYHRLACAIEDAGFEIRDTIAWLYGSGFPKSLDVGKAIDKAAGAVREVVGTSPNLAGRRFGAAGMNTDSGGIKDGRHTPGSVTSDTLTAPATPEAQQWNGWGTALKPAHEPVVVARKPLTGTVAANVLEHGTGALNVDGCRIEHDGRGVWGNHGQNPENHVTEPGSEGTTMGTGWERPGSTRHDAGRWPANVLLDPEAAELLDAHGNGEGLGGDSGGASRFFYVAKASRAERNAGLDGFEEGLAAKFDDGTRIRPGRKEPDTERQMRNVHPTVKPIALMRWLVRLVTPPGGTVLDPFTGSGTTGIAAVLEGFDFIGIEREAEYVEIANARIEHHACQPVQMSLT